MRKNKTETSSLAMILNDVPADTEHADTHDASAQAAPAGPLVRMWRGFTRFRRTRPFWGSLIQLWAAWLIGSSVLSKSLDFAFFAAIGPRGIAPTLIAFAMAAAALVALFAPAQRIFPAIIAVALAIAALPLANLGGLIIGTIAGITGGALIVAWTPYTDKDLARMAAKAERRQARRAARSAQPGAAR